ncbi:alpha-galactosidase [Klebsiella pneumoniae]|uniref:Alpha-galactosidase n=1 Tax=Klebsiella pneumoniae TaxID=573 RepID=A0A377ZPF8_KLEPN|nr:alpha-galactosidase [Klebsiella pneumoniae]
MKPSREYASTIMNAIWTGEPSVVYGNVRNDNLIDNLPQGCCVEVACLVDANGIQPTKVGALPAHLAALMQTNINVQTLLTQAILTENRDYVYYATMMDPHTAAVLGIEEIYALVDDLIASHGDWLPAGCTVNPLMPPGATNPAVPVTLYQTLKEALATATWTL